MDNRSVGVTWMRAMDITEGDVVNFVRVNGTSQWYRALGTRPVPNRDDRVYVKLTDNFEHSYGLYELVEVQVTA